MRLVNVQSKPVDHDVATRRNSHPADAVTTRSGATAHDLLQRSFQMHGKFNAMGIRQFVGTHIPSFGRGLDPLHVYQGISWISYDDVSSKSRAFGLGLCRLGLSPLPIEKSVACTDGFESLDGPHTLILFEHTSAEWLIAAVAAMTQSFTIVTIQASLGLVAVSEAINQCHAPAILCNYSDVKRMISLTASCPSLHTIIYSRNNVLDQEPPLLQTVTAGGRKIELRSFGDVLESGSSQEGSFTPPRPEHLALITYTSGVTGKPKGVMIKHKALVASITGLFSTLGPVLKPSTKSFQASLQHEFATVTASYGYFYMADLLNQCV
jgi:long-chain acyl-CoA synthetase